MLGQSEGLRHDRAPGKPLALSEQANQDWAKGCYTKGSVFGLIPTPNQQIYLLRCQCLAPV